MPGTGVGIWLGSTRSLHIPTPNDLRSDDVNRDVRSWYSAYPDVGSWTPNTTPDPDQISAWADLSKLPTGETLRLAHVSNADPDKQPQFDAAAATINGLPIVYSESGRASYLRSTHADLLAVVNDVPANTPHAILAVWRATGTNAILCEWSGGTGFEYGLHVHSSGNLRSSRYDGSTSSYKDFGSGLGSLVSTPQVVCVLYHDDLTADLWVGGQYRASVTHENLNALSTTYFQIHNDASTAQLSSTAEFAVFVGDHEYSGQLRMIAQAMGSRWGGLPA